MEFFGYHIEKVSEKEEMDLQRAKEVLDRHGFRAVRKTTDTTKKKESMKRATAARSQQATERLQNAWNMLLFSHKPEEITAYRLAKESGVSQPTAKKFIEKIKNANQGGTLEGL